MSRINPQTYVLNSSPMIGADGKQVIGIPQPLKTAAGKPVGSNVILARPLFNVPKPLGEVVHWRNAAARRRWNGDFKAAYNDKEGYKEKGCTIYGKADLVVVPLYRGIPMRLANEYRADNLREQRRKAAQTFMQRIRDAVGKLTTTEAPDAATA